MNILDQVWQSVFQDAPTLSQEAVLVLFREMDSLLWESLSLIRQNPTVLQDVVCLAGDVIGAFSHGKGIFARGQMILRAAADQREKPRPNIGLTWKVDPGIIFRYRNKADHDALRFMQHSMMLMCGAAHDEVTPEMMWGVGLSRASGEIVVQRFMQQAGHYRADTIKAALLRIRYLAARTPKRSAKLHNKLSRVSDRLLHTQAQMSCGAELYGVLGALQQRWTRYRELRERIYIPYLRVVFREARKRAQSEIQTLENFQNGAIGLDVAISNYNCQRGVFSSYARMWAAQGILWKLKEEANQIKLPAAVWQLANRLHEIAQRHAGDSIDGTYDLALVAGEAGIDTDRAQKILENIRSTQMLSIDYQTPEDSETPSLHETLEHAEP